MANSVLLVTIDLMTSSRVSGAAARVGATLQTVAKADGVVGLDDAVDIVLFDLASPIGDLESAVTQLRKQARPPATIIAFGPHVHEAHLEAARRAGCDQVMARGQFHATVDQILSADLPEK